MTPIYSDVVRDSSLTDTPIDKTKLDLPVVPFEKRVSKGTETEAPRAIGTSTPDAKLNSLTSPTGEQRQSVTRRSTLLGSKGEDYGLFGADNNNQETPENWAPEAAGVPRTTIVTVTEKKITRFGPESSESSKHAESVNQEASEPSEAVKRHRRCIVM